MVKKITIEEARKRIFKIVDKATKKIVPPLPSPEAIIIEFSRGLDNGVFVKVITGDILQLKMFKKNYSEKRWALKRKSEGRE